MTGTGGDAGPVFTHSYATVNVKSHVPMTLELKTSNFNKWPSFFCATCGKFGLLAHNGPVPTTRKSGMGTGGLLCLQLTVWLRLRHRPRPRHGPRHGRH
jgi:hypothetical protein